MSNQDLQTRREFLRLLALLMGGSQLSPQLLLKKADASTTDPTYLIVIGCWGGASIIDSFMAVTESEVTGAGGDAAGLNCFADSAVTKFQDSPFRAIDMTATLTQGNASIQAKQSAFVNAHKSNMLVITNEVSSVAHLTAQERSITGRDAWNGRTLQEAHAQQFGSKLLLPNVNMATGGYANPGTDKSVATNNLPYRVPNPISWPLGLHSTLGLNLNVDPKVLSLARALRSSQIDAGSAFGKTFSNTSEYQRWMNVRESRLSVFEAQGVISKLYFSEAAAPGLDPSVNASVRAAFPDYKDNPLQAQAALGFLLITKGLSSTVSIGTSDQAALRQNADGTSTTFNLPTSFDVSHTDIRNGQSFMWQQVLDVADRLINLLKSTPLPDGSGRSFWDRTMIYFATDFGRERKRPANAPTWGAGHDLNNGVLIVSPLVKGNRILGGMDAKTTLTYGFDLNTGSPDSTRNTSEKELYGGILHTLGVDVSGTSLPDIPAMRG